MESLPQLFGDPVVSAALWGIVIIALLDFLTGTIRAWANRTFDGRLIDTWVRGKLLGRVVPIVLVLIAGQLTPDLSAFGLEVNPFTVAGLTAAGTYIYAEARSIIDNLNPKAPDAPPNPVQ